MEFDVRISSGCEGLERCQRDWNALVQSLPDAAIYHDWRWYQTLASHVFGERLLLAAVYDGDKLAAAFPFLIKVRKLGPLSYRSLELLNHPEYIDLADALIAPGYENRDLLTLASQKLAEGGHRWDVCDLEAFPENSALCRLREVRAQARPTSQRNAFVSCVNEADLKSLSGKNLRNIERQIRRAEESGETVSLVEYRGLEAQTVFEEFLRIEDANWKGSSAGTSILRSEGARAFYQDLLQRFAASGEVSILLLKLGEHAGAAAFALRSNSRWYLFKIGYDERFAKFGAGSIMLKRFIEQKVNDPSAREVNLVTCPDWCERWHLHTQPLYNLLRYAPSPKGQLIKYARALIQRVRAKNKKEQSDLRAAPVHE